MISVAGTNPITTVNNGTCVFPFIYDGYEYNDCIDEDPYISFPLPPWCSLQYDGPELSFWYDYESDWEIERGITWDFCDVKVFGGTALDGASCAFPFYSDFFQTMYSVEASVTF